MSTDARVASVRIRCLNPLHELRRRGYPVELYSPGRSAAYSLVIYSKLYDDSIRSEARRLKANGARVVLDLCDNHFYNPGDVEALRIAARQLRGMIGEADALVASTEAMAEVLRQEAAPGTPITVIGDAVETTVEGVRTGPWERWRARRRLAELARWLGAEPGRTPLVWFGSHGGPSGDHGMGDLVTLRPLLESLQWEYPLSLTVISNSEAKFARSIGTWELPSRYLDWSAATFLDALRLHAVALIPVRDNPFTRCKTNNRLVTALAAGLAVVATGIPSYRPFERCCALDDWSGGLRRYISNPEARRQDVRAGQHIVQESWTLGSIATQWQLYFDRWRPG